MNARPAPGPGREATEDVLHNLVVGLTGLPGDLVRPRWQPRPPQTPGPDTSWCALGVTGRDSPGSQLVGKRSSATDGVASGSEPGTTSEGASGLCPARMESSEEWRIETHEVLDVLISFYGPQASALALAVREGLRVPLNRETLRAANMALVRAGQMVNAPELANNAWLRRVDLPLTFRLGPAHAVRGQRPEGAVDVPAIASAPVCGLCSYDR